MSLEFSKAKNNSETCKWKGMFLHSAYNPEQEAKRFAESINPDFIPENIIVIEPALSYCLQFLKEKFSNARFFSIRFITDLPTKYQFDHDFYYNPDKPEKLKTDLFNYLGESSLLNSFFITWPPAHNVFQEFDSKCWNIIKDLLKECQSILATRQYFSSRWIKNQINFLLNLKQTCGLKNFNLPVLICASGSSLKDSLPEIKKMSDHFFIIACSSGIKALLKHGIIPDLCISTDGGFWAKKHLQCLINTTHDIKLAVSSEANIPTALYNNEHISIVPLAYCDNFDNTIYEELKIPYIKANRNGTISGTAVDLALSLTDSEIYLSGIDMETSKGFVHTQPNELETENSIKDFKLKPIDNRVYIQGRDSTQLQIYRNWFISKSDEIKNRVFRISNHYPFINSLGFIKDISFDDITGKYASVKNIEPLFSPTTKNSDNHSKIINYFKKLIADERWIENYFPADCLMIKRNEDSDKILNSKSILNNKLDKISEYIYKRD